MSVRRSRRMVLAILGALGASIALGGHTPYRQWVIMRRRFLIVFTSREDAASDVLGEEIARVLLKNLPTSRAEVVRGPTSARIASLMATQQADVAVLSKQDAIALHRGVAPFEDLPATPLRVIVETATHQFVCRDDFPARHGYLVAEALMKERSVLGVAVPEHEVGTTAAADGVPTHPGALAFIRGEPLDPP